MTLEQVLLEQEKANIYQESLSSYEILKHIEKHSETPWTTYMKKIQKRARDEDKLTK